MPRPRPPYLHREETRHGEVSWYVRRGRGRRIRVRAEYGSEAFWREYRAALEGAVAATPPTKPQSLEWALDRYRTHRAWTGLASATRRQREGIFRTVIKTAGSHLLTSIDQQAIKDGRERRSSKPHAANNFLKAMRGFFAWAVDDKLVAADPTKGVKLLAGENDAVGFHTWSEEEVARFEAFWPVGTRERLAFDLLLYTGIRRGDVVRLGRPHIRDGVITLRTEKEAGDGTVVIPLLECLAATITASKTGDLTFLTTERGTPFVKESFGNWFRKACRRAGCPGSAHGLRKAGARRAAEHGATERQLMALFGWSTGKMATHYTHAADKKLLAAQAAELLKPARKENEKRPHLRSGAGANRNRGNRSGA